MSGKMNKTMNKFNQNRVVPDEVRLLLVASVPERDLLADMKESLKILQEKLSDPTRQVPKQIKRYQKDAISRYERAVKASIGMPTFSDSVTTQFEASKDIPTVPLSGYQLVERTCQIVKSATFGATAGGFFAQLSTNDLAPFVNPNTQIFRVKRITSWTVPRADGNLTQGTFAGVAVPKTSSEGNTVTPIWSENWTPVGQGFAGIVTVFPLGDFPQYTSAGTNTLIANHYTALGGTGGITAIPVVFHVQIETLI